MAWRVPEDESVRDGHDMGEAWYRLPNVPSPAPARPALPRDLHGPQRTAARRVVRPRLGPYEVAEYCIQQRTRVLVLLNAWLDSRTGKDGKGIEAHPEDGEDADEETDWRTIEYWAMRLRPLWAKVVQEAQSSTGTTHQSKRKRETETGGTRMRSFLSSSATDPGRRTVRGPVMLPTDVR
ncbi:hypothetical protein NUW54_g14374 [Trametes sanguinea]|uniref:Uncharacterized protein n=1 Tax=Trametes sanguinea TaxID=158606 RepID=A0ACC1MET2_9APHY|nr:hypothetical protein NUW54_g14374 [Trametes sanguinea]